VRAPPPPTRLSNHRRRHVLPACRREELQQPVFMAIDALEFPELHDESIPAMAFIRHLSRLLQAAGVRDWSLKARAGS
jgi:kinetochore protein Nuf2